LSNEPDTRPLRSDARRNRARVLAAARELFAAEGVDVPLDEIARRAGVGAGTVHRHFPAKDALLREIVLADLQRRLDAARAEAKRADPAEALFGLLEGLLDDGLSNAALKTALAASGIDLASERTDELDGLLAELLRGAQRAGAVRDDLDVNDVKAVLAAGLAAQAYQGIPAGRVRHIRALIFEGLRPPSTGRPTARGGKSSL
jgi:AcrR family transcriptional regulator